MNGHAIGEKRRNPSSIPNYRLYGFLEDNFPHEIFLGAFTHPWEPVRPVYRLPLKQQAVMEKLRQRMNVWVGQWGCPPTIQLEKGLAWALHHFPTGCQCKKSRARVWNYVTAGSCSFCGGWAERNTQLEEGRVYAD
jgi:hypothetical protein